MAKAMGGTANLSRCRRHKQEKILRTQYVPLPFGGWAARWASLGLYRNKAKQIVGFAKGVVEQFDGKVPQTMEELTTLPGIGRKCANVILAECFNIPSIAVDTHVARISRRLGLCYQKDDVQKIERKLMRKIPRDRWIKTHHQMIFFGRYLCHARNPECYRCPFVNGCHEKQKNLTPPKTK